MCCSRGTEYPPGAVSIRTVATGDDLYASLQVVRAAFATVAARLGLTVRAYRL